MDLIQRIISNPVAVGFVAALLVVGPATIVYGGRLGYQMGGGEWSFTESWASTFTLLGAFFVTVLGSGVLPEEEAAATGTVAVEPATAETAAAAQDASAAAELASALTGLSLLFALMVLIAPVVYAALSGRYELTTPEPKVEYRGVVWGFLVSALVILWGAFGQLAALWLLVVPELRQGQALAGMTEWLFRGALAVGVLAGAVYAWKSISWNILDCAYESVAARTHQVIERRLIPGQPGLQEVPATVVEPLPKWSLL